MKKRILKLIQLRADKKAAEKKFDTEIKKLFPIDSEIRWYKNGVQFGVVVYHCYSGDFWVRNRYTSSEYRITPYDIERSLELNMPQRGKKG